MERRILFSIVFILLFFIPAAGSALPGDRDLSFGSPDGYVEERDCDDEYGRASALQSDGKIIVAGSQYPGGEGPYRMMLLRFHADGSPDTGFGDMGRAVWENPETLAIHALSIQEDGKILVLGVIYRSWYRDILLARFNPDGSLDETFGEEGIVIRPGEDVDIGRAMALQEDGKILVCGERRKSSGEKALILFRFLPDGTLDPQLGDSGTVTPLPEYWASGYSVLVRPGGAIVVTGMAGNWIMAVQLNPDGTLDATFGDQGVFTHSVLLSCDWTAAALHTDGGILVLSGTNSICIKISTTGNLDPNFGTDGILSLDRFSARCIRVQTDGNILMIGDTAVYNNPCQGSQRELLIRRYDSAGNPDPAYGTEGQAGYFESALYTYGRSESYGRSAVLTPGGGLVVCGDQGKRDEQGILLLGYTAQGLLDPGFGTGGVVSYGFTDEHAAGLVIQDDGKILVGGDRENNHTSEIMIVRYDEHGNPDPEFGNSGMVIRKSQGFDYTHSLALLSDGRILVLAQFQGTKDASPELLVVRLNPDGSPDTGFGMDGEVRLAEADQKLYPEGLSVQEDGSFLVAGTQSTESESDIVLFRFTEDGGLDPDFGDSGRVLFDSGYTDYGSGVLIHPDGRILVAGCIRDSEIISGPITHRGTAAVRVGRNTGSVLWRQWKKCKGYR